MVLKIVGLIATTILASVILLTNKNNEDVAAGIVVFYLMALAIIFIPLGEVINFAMVK